MKKQYPGHAKRVMLGVWSFLRRFITQVCDRNRRRCKCGINDVIWAMTTRMDPALDTTMIENTPIDYKTRFSGFGIRFKDERRCNQQWPGETIVNGVPITMNEDIKQQ